MEMGEREEVEQAHQQQHLETSNTSDDALELDGEDGLEDMDDVVTAELDGVDDVEELDAMLEESEQGTSEGTSVATEEADVPASHAPKPSSGKQQDGDVQKGSSFAGKRRPTPLGVASTTLRVKKSKIDLKSGFMKRIHHYQKVRNKIEEDWQSQQTEEKKTQRIIENMPSQADLRKKRKDQIARSGPSQKYASLALMALKRGPVALKTLPKVSQDVNKAERGKSDKSPVIVAPRPSIHLILQLSAKDREDEKISLFLHPGCSLDEIIYEACLYHMLPDDTKDALLDYAKKLIEKLEKE